MADERLDIDSENSVEGEGENDDDRVYGRPSLAPVDWAYVAKASGVLLVVTASAALTARVLLERLGLM